MRWSILNTILYAVEQWKGSLWSLGHSFHISKGFLHVISGNGVNDMQIIHLFGTISEIFYDHIYLGEEMDNIKDLKTTHLYFGRNMRIPFWEGKV